MRWKTEEERRGRKGGTEGEKGGREDEREKERMENGEEEEEKPFPFKYLFDPNWNPSFLIEFRSGQAKNRTFPLFSGMGVCPGQTVFCRCRLEPFPTITVEV